jgi:hypothetical protein
MRSGPQRRKSRLPAPLRAPLRLQARLALPQLFALLDAVPCTHPRSDVFQAATQAVADGRVSGLVCAGRITRRAATDARLRDRLGCGTGRRWGVRADPAGIWLVRNCARFARTVGERRDAADGAPIERASRMGLGRDRLPPDDYRQHNVHCPEKMRSHVARLARDARHEQRAGRAFGPKLRRRLRCAPPGCAAGVRTLLRRRNR